MRRVVRCYKTDVTQHGWKKYFSFWDRGPKTLKFSARFAFFQMEYLLICGYIFIGVLA